MYLPTILTSCFRSLLHQTLAPISSMIYQMVSGRQCAAVGLGAGCNQGHDPNQHRNSHRSQAGLLIGLVLGLFLTVTLGMAPAEARVQAKVSDIHYTNCPPELAHNLVLGGGVMSANCFLIQGTVHNDSGKVLLNADVFGRIYDANGNDAMPERGRLGSVESVPVGDSPFEIMVTVPADQPEPLSLKQFKISGFTGKVRR